MTEQSEYRGRRFGIRTRFWMRFFYETATQRRVEKLVMSRLGCDEPISVCGHKHLCEHDVMVLAVNHYNGRAALDSIAAILQAAISVRPDLPERLTLIVGRRQNQPKKITCWLGLPIRLLHRWVFHRWGNRIIRLPLHNPEASISGLRQWRNCAMPTMVFPEGRGSLTFSSIRPSAGVWLSTLAVPTIPTAVWWRRDVGWQVRFGQALRWTPRRDLRDIQLGLALAALLPSELAPGWQPDLERWRAAHQQSVEHCSMFS